MFNSYDMKTTNNLNINACSGGIYKTYPESWFQRFHLQSKVAERLLQEKPQMDIIQERF